MIRIALSCLLLLAVPAVGAAADMRLLAGDRAGATVELTLSGYHLQPVDGPFSPSHTRIEIADLATEGEPGDPRLPVAGTLIGFPEGATPQVVDVETDTESLSGVRIAPVPTVEVSADPLAGKPARTALVESRAYGRDALFPAEIAVIGFTGELRGQPVAQLRLHPVQTNPVTGETLVHTRIRVTIAFRPPDPAAVTAKPSGRRAGRGPRGPAPPAFREMMRRSLINFPALEN